MKELTKAEEQVMQILWKKKRAVVRDILEEFDEPKPAYNTVSTIVRILEEKGVVGHKAYGRTHEYYPLLTKDAYRKGAFSRIFKNYFENSFESMVSYFVKEKKMTVEEIEEIVNKLKNNK